VFVYLTVLAVGEGDDNAAMVMRESENAGVWVSWSAKGDNETDGGDRKIKLYLRVQERIEQIGRK
jgi:hypothetical protein